MIVFGIAVSIVFGLIWGARAALAEAETGASVEDARLTGVVVFIFATVGVAWALFLLWLGFNFVLWLTTLA